MTIQKEIPGLELRLGLRPEDVPLLAAAESACFSDPWPQAAFQAELDNPYCFYLLAFADGQLAGYIGGVALYENCDVNNLAVLPQMRRRGIAAALLSGFLEEARRRGAGQVMLEVREHNLPAMALYRRFGFSACGKRKNYYQNPAEDAVIMVVELC